MDKIREIDSRIKILEEEIKLKRMAIEELQKEKFHLQYKKVTWKELEDWLKINRPDNDYEKNPVVYTYECDFGYAQYCKLTKDGELQVGPYYRNDRFSRGCDLFVDFNSRWR